MKILLPALSQNGSTNLVVWIFGGQSTVPSLHSPLVFCINFLPIWRNIFPQKVNIDQAIHYSNLTFTNDTILLCQEVRIYYLALLTIFFDYKPEEKYISGHLSISMKIMISQLSVVFQYSLNNKLTNFMTTLVTIGILQVQKMVRT